MERREFERARLDTKKGKSEKRESGKAKTTTRFAQAQKSSQNCAN
jgi:hypothetical protein